MAAKFLVATVPVRDGNVSRSPRLANVSSRKGLKRVMDRHQGTVSFTEHIRAWVTQDAWDALELGRYSPFAECVDIKTAEVIAS